MCDSKQGVGGFRPCAVNMSAVHAMDTSTSYEAPASRFNIAESPCPVMFRRLVLPWKLEILDPPTPLFRGVSNAGVTEDVLFEATREKLKRTGGSGWRLSDIKRGKTINLHHKFGRGVINLA